MLLSSRIDAMDTPRRDDGIDTPWHVRWHQRLQSSVPWYDCRAKLTLRTFLEALQGDTSRSENRFGVAPDDFFCHGRKGDPNPP